MITARICLERRYHRETSQLENKSTSFKKKWMKEHLPTITYICIQL